MIERDSYCNPAQSQELFNVLIRQVPSSLDSPSNHHSSTHLLQNQGETTLQQNLLSSLNKEIKQVGCLDQRDGKEKRDDNTIFKTSASQFRKSIIDVVKKFEDFKNLQAQNQQLCKVQNQSTFPKLISFVRAFKIQKEVLERWNFRKPKLLEKKRKLIQKGEFTQKRFEALKDTIIAMDMSLKQSNLQKCVDIYWGDFTHFNKHENSKQQVILYDVGLRNQLTIPKLRDLEVEKAEKKTKKNKKTKPIGKHNQKK